MSDLRERLKEIQNDRHISGDRKADESIAVCMDKVKEEIGYMPQGEFTYLNIMELIDNIKERK